MLSVLIRETLRLLFRIFFLFPLKKDTVLVDSMFGKGVSDNAGAYVRQQAGQGKPGRKIIWGLQDPGAQPEIPGVRFVKYGSVKWFYYHSTAKVILYSHHLYNYLPMRKGQYHVMMWHAGGAYKRIGAGVAGNSEKDRRLHEYRNRYINEPGVIFLSSSELFTKYNIREVYRFTGRIENTGMPRNDIFFDQARVKAAAEKVRKALGLPADAETVLYAPTFRMAEIREGKSTAPLDGGALLQALRDKGVKHPVLLYRCHYYEKSSLENDGSVIDVSGYPDMQELLCCADRLVTDYSSCIWDYALTGRPCYLYVPDLENYENREQGFFTPIESWPGEICESTEALRAAVLREDAGAFARKAEEHLRAAGSFEDGKACERLDRLISELTGADSK